MYGANGEVKLARPGLDLLPAGAEWTGFVMPVKSDEWDPYLWPARAAIRGPSPASEPTRE